MQGKARAVTQVFTGQTQARYKWIKTSTPDCGTEAEIKEKLR